MYACACYGNNLHPHFYLCHRYRIPRCCRPVLCYLHPIPRRSHPFLAALAASLAICVAMAEKLFRRWDIVISGFALIVSRRAIVVSHHEMTLDVISGMIGALGGVVPAPSAPTAMVGRVAEAATHGASIAGNGKM